MIFNETIIPIQWATAQYWIVVCNADGSAIWGWSSWTTPYTMLAYYDTSDLTYDYAYYCEAISWTLETDAKWRAFRVQTNKAWDFISKKWANWFTHLWDETTIKSLIYS